MIQWKFTKGVEEQTEAFLSGFNEVVPLEWLKYFDEREIEVKFMIVLKNKIFILENSVLRSCFVDYKK